MYFVFLEIIMWFVGLGVAQHPHPLQALNSTKAQHESAHRYGAGLVRSSIRIRSAAKLINPTVSLNQVLPSDLTS